MPRFRMPLLLDTGEVALISLDNALTPNMFPKMRSARFELERCTQELVSILEEKPDYANEIQITLE